MRTLSSSVMALLVVAALFWGNCLSCPQVFQALKNHQPLHGCCHRTKKTPDGCHTQALQQFEKADLKAPAHPVAVPVALVAAIVVTAPEQFTPATPAEPSPPALLPLLASLRI